MKTKPLVSVLIPIYNVEKYVKESIASIQNQTYKNIEIIIIDDGSSDRTSSIAHEMAEKDDRIKFYQNEENLGIVKTLNRALELSRGDYILRMDGDDVSDADRIEKKIAYLEEFDDVDLVGCSLTAIDPEGNVIKKIKKIDNFSLIKKILRYTSPVSHVWLCRRSVYDTLSGYRDLPGAEDYDFILRLVSSGMKCTNLNDYYGYYVRLGRSGNTISINGIEQKKLHEYIYRMYRRRIHNKNEGYIPNYRPKYFAISKILYYFANQKFHSAKVNFAEKKYLCAILDLIQTALSPHMLHIYFLRLIYKYKTHGKV